MTHPPTAPPPSPPGATAGQGPAIPAPAGPRTPPGAPPSAPPATHPSPQPGAAPDASLRSAVRDGVRRLRAATRTEPGRLRLLGAAVAALLLLLGAVTAWQVSDRSDAAHTVVHSSQPLSADAAEIYRSLANANAMAATGFLAGTDEDPQVRDTYEQDVSLAGELLAEAAAHGQGTGRSQEIIELLSSTLGRYAGLVESARANNRQGYPIGGAYLRYADDLMQAEMLPLAEELYELENDRLTRDIDAAQAVPWPALALGAVALGVLAWSQRRNYHHTNRVFNPGLLAATAAAVVLLAWLAGAHTLARGSLHEADADAARSLGELNTAWTEALKARTDENMWLVARGAGDDFEDAYQQHMDVVVGRGGDGGLLAEAAALADDEEGRRPVEDAVRAAEEWRETHQAARRSELDGDYDAALDRVIGQEESTGSSFEEVDASLRAAIAHEQREFEDAASSGHAALRGLVVGAAALAVLAALSALAGVRRRLAEYR
ncbi:hypothetical protein ACTWP5_12020 [Streptomyces sp. 4N509B]|uniref:hypothetical protein n=1 Tax=Streptomyces sp. 4N509B TaxID=3457413 RepID=UPI003FD301B0